VVPISDSADVVARNHLGNESFDGCFARHDRTSGLDIDLQGF
jgi:hypothetical protein